MILAQAKCVVDRLGAGTCASAIQSIHYLDQDISTSISKPCRNKHKQNIDLFHKGCIGSTSSTPRFPPHVNMDNPSLQYACEACEQKFSTPQQARSHMDRNSHWRTYWCSVCKAGFQNNNNLQQVNTSQGSPMNCILFKLTHRLKHYRGAPHLLESKR